MASLQIHRNDVTIHGQCISTFHGGCKLRQLLPRAPATLTRAPATPSLLSLRVLPVELGSSCSTLNPQWPNLNESSDNGELRRENPEHRQPSLLWRD